MMIANPMDEKQNEIIRIIEKRDDSTPVGRLYLKIADRIAAMEEPPIEDVDMSDPEQVAIWKTVQILLNKVIYADAYLDSVECIVSAGYQVANMQCTAQGESPGKRFIFQASIRLARIDLGVIVVTAAPMDYANLLP